VLITITKSVKMQRALSLVFACLIDSFIPFVSTDLFVGVMTSFLKWFNLCAHVVGPFHLHILTIGVQETTEETL
jgi:hypothetical protein